MAELGALAGEAFVYRNPTSLEIEGEGEYFGFPLLLRLTPGERDGKLGYVVAIHIAPLEPRKVAG